ncbi:MAG: DUF3108 domain-containing protein [Myxococcota bacterium]|nr:DUF3108 domain-containing protein [Myxococcota bacterium]
MLKVHLGCDFMLKLVSRKYSSFFGLVAIFFAIAPGASAQALRTEAKSQVLKVPRTPDGLDQCTESMILTGELPGNVGETLRYRIELEGVSVGTIDFLVAQKGVFEGRSTVDYRSHFKIDSFVASLLPVEGRAAALVARGQDKPIQAMTQYRMQKDAYEERLVFALNTTSFDAIRRKNQQEKRVKAAFSLPVRDFVTAFYMLRRLPKEERTCVLIYGNLRTYTIQFRYTGQEEVQTPVGLRMADRYDVLYGTNRGKRLTNAVVWVGIGENRLPYRVEVNGKHKLKADIHLFQPGVVDNPL